MYYLQPQLFFGVLFCRDTLHCVLLLDAKSGATSTNLSEKISPIMGYNSANKRTSSGYTESVMLIPENIRTTTKEFLSALSCILL